MLILPLKLVSKDDKELVGEDIYNLCKLAKNNFPVALGLVVFPIDFQKILQRLNVNNKLDFEKNSSFIKKLLFEHPIPHELSEELMNKLGKKMLQKIWLQLLDGWFFQLSKNPNKCIAQVIFYVEKIITSGTVYLEENFSLKQYVDKSKLNSSFLVDSKISVKKGFISPKQMQSLELLVYKMDRILGIPQTYHFIIDLSSGSQQLKIIKLSQFTIAPKDVFKNDRNLLTFEELNNRVQSDKFTLKKYIEHGSDLELDDNFDGIVISSNIFDNFREKINELLEIAKDNTDKIILYKLINLEEDAKVVLDLRNKQKFLNIQILTPSCKSVFEFISIKRQLASLGITRKASLKLWAQLTTPENLLNVEDYVNQGLDGVLINLDETLNNLSGEKEHMHYTNSQINALLKFMEESLRTLNKLKVPVLISGKAATLDDVLKFLILKGVYGLVINSKNNIPESDFLWVQANAHKSLLA